MQKNNPRSLVQQQCQAIQRQVCHNEAVDFFNVLTGPHLLELTDSLLPEHRERLYAQILYRTKCSGEEHDG